MGFIPKTSEGELDMFTLAVKSPTMKLTPEAAEKALPSLETYI